MSHVLFKMTLTIDETGHINNKCTIKPQVLISHLNFPQVYSYQQEMITASSVLPGYMSHTTSDLTKHCVITAGSCLTAQSSSFTGRSSASLSWWERHVSPSSSNQTVMQFVNHGSVMRWRMQLGTIFLILLLPATCRFLRIPTCSHKVCVTVLPIWIL